MKKATNTENFGKNQDDESEFEFRFRGKPISQEKLKEIWEKNFSEAMAPKKIVSFA
jgi:hypothetical protein